MKSRADKISKIMIFCAFAQVTASSFANPNTSKTISLPAPHFRVSLQGKSIPVHLAFKKPWTEVSQVQRDPLAISQWVNHEQQCASGASQKISIYAFDSGTRNTPRALTLQKLVHKLFPEALRFEILPSEAGFYLVKMDSEGFLAKGIVAFPQSESQVTPLRGFTPGVRVAIVAESSTSDDLTKLESDLRNSLKSLQRASSQQSLSKHPYVLLGEKWSKPIEKELALDSKGTRPLPTALLSLAYGLFTEAAGYVPAGQIWLKKAADLGEPAGQLGLLQLQRAGHLALPIEPKVLQGWSEHLKQVQQEDELYFQAQLRPFTDSTEDETTILPVRELAECGHREARIQWAKYQAESFDKDQRRKGRQKVLELVQTPPLLNDLNVYHRVPRGFAKVDLFDLKMATLLKTACSVDDGSKEVESELFVKREDFSLKPKSTVKPKANPAAAVPAIADIELIKRLESLVNAGGKPRLLEAQKLSCAWPGSETDRSRLAAEVAARREGFGKWRPLRACRFISDSQLAEACRNRVTKQNQIALDLKFDRALKMANPSLREAMTELRSVVRKYATHLLIKSYESASISEVRELDRLAFEIESEFLAMTVSVLANSLDQEVRDLITSRRLMLIDGSKEFEDLALFSSKSPERKIASTMALTRRPISDDFLKREKHRLASRFDETLKSINSADDEDISTAVKSQMSLAYQDWQEYRELFDQFAVKVAKSTSGSRNTVAESRFAAEVWFYVGGIYHFEQIRNREMSRPRNSESEEEDAESDDS